MDSIRKILEAVEKEHPYKIPSRRETYDKYNEGWTDAVYRIESMLPEQTEEDWISVDKDMPKEYDSIFARYYGTDKWNRHMWSMSSEKVLVTLEFEDGIRKVDVARTKDGKWDVSNRIVKQKVIAWKKMPEEYKGK